MKKNLSKKIYYWASNIEKNSGEGILANKFLNLLNRNYKNYKFIKLNNFNNKDNFLYNYVLPFWGIVKIWKYYLKGNKVSYVNYLPIWNIFIFLFLPKKTIFGPITGTDTKKNPIYNLFKLVGIYFLKKSSNNLLFSHDQFKKYFTKRRNIFYNFLFYEFKIKHLSKNKKFDIVFYYKKNKNKGNNFLISILKNIPSKYSIAIFGDFIPDFKIKKNIKNFGTISRKKAINIISLSKFALTSKENHFSFFALDSVSRGLNVFYNKKLKIYKDLKTNMFFPLDFNDINFSLNYIVKNLAKKKRKTFFYFSYKNFDEYLFDK